MVKHNFHDRRAWVFDLDNTLYPPSARLFDQIEQRMTQYVMDTLSLPRAEADRLRNHYWAEYGTTLAGLMQLHDLDPAPYLTHVHEIDLSQLQPDPRLCARIKKLPGKRVVYTNGSAPYAERVLAARGLAEAFDEVFGVEHAEFRPKPEQAAFETVLAQAKIDPSQAVMFEDDARNLQAPHALGMRTVHVAPQAEPQDHIHHHTDDLNAFLGQLTQT